MQRHASEHIMFRVAHCGNLRPPLIAVHTRLMASATPFYVPGPPSRVPPPPSERNAPHIGAVLKQYLADQDRSYTLVEAAAGTAYHANVLAPTLPHVQWLPTDSDEANMPSMKLWVEDHPECILEPQLVDLISAHSPSDWRIPASAPPVGAILCVNMTHVAPWEATLGLLRAAHNLLPVGGLLFLYGPFKVYGKIEPESNAKFDATLRAHNPEWGYREVADIVQEANNLKLSLEEQKDMPANNFMLIFKKQ